MEFDEMMEVRLHLPHEVHQTLTAMARTRGLTLEELSRLILIGWMNAKTASPEQEDPKAG